MSTSDEMRIQAAILLEKAAELETPLSQDQIHAMFKARMYDELEQARKDGRIDYTMATKPKEN
jgi:hypothetical protein